MTDAEFNEFKSSLRMTEFVGLNKNLLVTNAKVVSTNSSLLENIAVLGSAGANRVSAAGSRKDSTIDKLAAKDALYALVRKIGETGKTIKQEESNFDNKFKVPRGNLSGQQLLETANAFVNDLTTEAAAKFAHFGLSETLVADLTARINDFEVARIQKNTSKGSGVAATAQTKAAIAELKKNRRTLKTVVNNILEDHGDAGLIAEWESACKLEKKKPTPPETPPTA